MKTNYSTKLIKLFAISIIIISLYSCSEDDTNTVVPTGPEANTISGTITFVDTNFLSTGGYYDLSAFNAWFPAGNPTRSDSLIITKVGNQYQANYKLTNVPNGTYYLTAAWIKLPYGPGSVYGLSLYGCDTMPCMTPTGVTITDDIGRENINLISWADTTNNIYNF